MVSHSDEGKENIKMNTNKSPQKTSSRKLQTNKIIIITDTPPKPVTPQSKPQLNPTHIHSHTHTPTASVTPLSMRPPSNRTPTTSVTPLPRNLTPASRLSPSIDIHKSLNPSLDPVFMTPVSTWKNDLFLAMAATREQELLSEQESSSLQTVLRLERENDDYEIAAEIAQIAQQNYSPSPIIFRSSRSPGAFRFTMDFENQFSPVGAPAMTYEELSNLQSVEVGVSQEILESLKSFEYKDQDLSETNCPICIDVFSEGDELRKLECGHVYHRPCIDTWLYKSKKCPMCKSIIK